MIREKNKTIIIITIVLLVIICLVCLCLIAVTAGLIAIKNKPLANSFETIFFTQATPTSPTWPTSEASDNFLYNNNIDENLLSTRAADETLRTLLEEVVPINDPLDLAERLSGKENIPELFPDPNKPYQVGDEKMFWVSNTDTNENFQINAVLRYLGDHLYFWIEESVAFNKDNLDKLARTFDQEIYPTTRQFFGSEWLPGVDEDPRIYVLYTGNLGNSVAGYFSSADELHPAAHLYSNAHEMFLINSDTVDLGDDYIYGTMAHEFQHMIHWHNDRNEETWLNEGFSMLSELINEFDSGGFDFLYSSNTDLQLTNWGGETGANGPHYGASFLFTTYFLDRFGTEATKALINHRENGMTSLGLVMEELNLLNPDTHKPYTSNEFFSDWAVTNYLLNPDIEIGRYDYKSYAPFKAQSSETIDKCPSSQVRDVFQFGVNYLEFQCKGDYTIEFLGVSQVKLIPMASDHSGDYFFWSNMGDDSNMSLTREFDMSDVQSPVSMNYKIWHDLEDGYDYLFLSASTDKKTWEILNTTSCTTDDPSGNSYGCGYTGKSGGWIEESVELSEYSGTKVNLRFDYVTDAAVNGIGLAIDDIVIDAIEYHTDFESDDGGWKGDGFVRIQNSLPQTFNLSIIEIGEEVTVKNILLDNNNSALIPVQIGDSIEKVVLVISGTTPFTKERAIYKYEIK